MVYLQSTTSAFYVILLLFTQIQIDECRKALYHYFRPLNYWCNDYIKCSPLNGESIPACWQVNHIKQTGTHVFTYTTHPCLSKAKWKAATRALIRFLTKTRTHTNFDMQIYICVHRKHSKTTRRQQPARFVNCYTLRGSELFLYRYLLYNMYVSLWMFIE